MMPSSDQIALRLQAAKRRGCGPRGRAPRRRGRGRRTARARTAASRRSRRGSAPRRRCGRTARRASPPAARAGRRAGCAAARSSRSYSRSSTSGSCSTAQRAKAPTAAPSSRGRPTRVAVPEGHGAGHARRRRDHDPVARDLLDAPRGRAEQEGLPHPGLVDHLLVELADPAPVGQVHREQPAVGDRARVGHGQRAGAAAGADRALEPVPHDPRPQLAELLRRVATVEHVEHVLELAAVELGVGPGAPEQLVQVVDGDAFVAGGGRDGDHLLGEHVERVARHDRRLDQPFAHAAHHDGALEQIGPELGEDPSPRHLADAVTGAADALQPAGHRLRRLDLHDQVDGAHVDAELE